MIDEGTQPRINTDQHRFKNRLSRHSLIRVYLCSSVVKISLAFVWLLFSAALFQSTAADIEIDRPMDSFGFLKPVPVNISGFTGETDSVLKQDLIFMGVVHVPIEEAKYLV